jgi:glutamate racemase
MQESIRLFWDVRIIHFYTSIIEQLTGNKIRVIDPAPAVANRTRELLIAHDLLNISVEPGKDVFYTSGETEVLRLLVTNITGPTAVGTSKLKIT